MTRALAVTRDSRTEAWADQITIQLSKTVEAILEVGRLLIKAKAGLPHGEFLRMFDEHLVPFGEDTGERFMKIARHPILSNSAHVRSLPASWSTLYALSKVENATLTTAIETGVVTPDIQRRDLAALLSASPKQRQPRKRATVPASGRTPGSRLYFQIAQLLSDEFDKLSQADQDDCLGLLDQALADSRAGRSGKAL